MATIKRYRYIVNNDANYINDNPQIKVYKGNSSNQAELIYSSEVEEVISTDINFTKTTFTEAEVEAAVKCNAVSNFKVGDILTISSSRCSQWVVIGKNHDSTTGTIDIMATNQVDRTNYNSNYYNPNDGTHVPFSLIAFSYYNFTNMIISSAFKTINFKVPYNTYISFDYNAKVKPISCVELNLNTFPSSQYEYDSYKESEGKPYSDYFPAAAYNTAVAKRWVREGSYYGDSDYYWTRSISGSSYTYVVGNTGLVDHKMSNNSYYGVVPILRLGSMIYE